MDNYELAVDEVILYEGKVTSKNYKGDLQLTLTSQRIVMEQEKGKIKKVCELIGIMELSTIKMYNGVAQIKQHNSDVELQSTEGVYSFSFANLIEARKFTGKAIDATTGTTLAKRVSGKTKDAFEMLDDTLGLDTRGTVKGVLEKGVKGVIISGIGKKK